MKIVNLSVRIWMHITFLFFFLIPALALSCTRIIMPPPNPNSFPHWESSDQVVYGTVSSIETNINQSWLEKLMIDMGNFQQKESTQLKQPYRIIIKDAYYFVGEGKKLVEYEISGCGVPVPKLGEKVLLFISNKSPKIIPIFEQDGEWFSTWHKYFQKNIHSSLSNKNIASDFGAANGGLLLYPNKPNNNQMQSVYSK